MKKILLSLAGIAMATTAIVGVTRAYFSDTETSTGNTFTAGTLDLELTDWSEDGTQGEAGTFQFSNMAPGDKEGEPMVLRNTGNLNGYIDLSNIVVTNTEGINPESETGDIGTIGELGANLRMKVFFDKNSNALYDAGSDVLVYEGILDNIATAYNTNYFLASGDNVRLRVHYELPTSTGNDVQGDIADLSFNVVLNQVAD
jgi:spore coat-associated protein N